jgi:hypothetical protein
MGARLDVTAEGCEVLVPGILPQWVSEELIKRYALEVSGVDKVNTDLTVLLESLREAQAAERASSSVPPSEGEGSIFRGLA